MGFEPTISAGERPQTYALDRTATGTDQKLIQLGGNFSHQVHWLQLCQQVEAPEEASCLPTLQMVANFHRVAMPGKTYAVRTITPNQISLLTVRMESRCAISTPIITKHYVRRAQLLLLRARLRVSTLIIGHLQASLQFS